MNSTTRIAAAVGAALGGFVGGIAGTAIAGRAEMTPGAPGEKGGPTIMYGATAGAALGAMLFGWLAAPAACPTQQQASSSTPGTNLTNVTTTHQ